MNPVLVRGDGVAAYCCAHLLGRAGIPVTVDRPSRPRVPAIMLSEAAVSLIADVFGHKDLFRDLPRIQSRTVLWGPGATPVTLPHSAVVVSEQMLLDHIRPHSFPEERYADPEWQVFASRPLPPESVEQGFGSRMARATSVTSRTSLGPGCWIESVDDGWLFLIGADDGTGWLLSVGGADLNGSRLIARQIEQLGESRGEFPCHPRIIAPLCGKSNEGRRWLACGTASIAFDPICGDGTAHAVREAILAAAVIRAVAAGAPAEPLFAHYESRLTAAFQRHLEHCLGYYRAGGDSTWWSEERRALENGLAWCAERMSTFPSFRYRLNGFDLEAVA